MKLRWKIDGWRKNNMLGKYEGQYVLLHIGQRPAPGNSEPRKALERALDELTAIARRIGLLGVGQHLEGWKRGVPKEVWGGGSEGRR